MYDRVRYKVWYGQVVLVVEEEGRERENQIFRWEYESHAHRVTGEEKRGKKRVGKGQCDCVSPGDARWALAIRGSPTAASAASVVLW